MFWTVDYGQGRVFVTVLGHDDTNIVTRRFRRLSRAARSERHGKSDAADSARDGEVAAFSRGARMTAMDEASRSRGIRLVCGIGWRGAGLKEVGAIARRAAGAAALSPAAEIGRQMFFDPSLSASIIAMRPATTRRTRYVTERPGGAARAVPRSRRWACAPSRRSGILNTRRRTAINWTAPSG
jgi:hypothetical protein